MHWTKKEKGGKQILKNSLVDKELANRARRSEKLLHPAQTRWVCWSSSWAPYPPHPPPLPCSESQGMGANSCSPHLPRAWVTGFIEGIGLLEGGDGRMFPPTSLSQEGLRQRLNLFLGSTSRYQAHCGSSFH